MTKEYAHQLRALLEKASAFLNDGDASNAPELFPMWAPDKDYVKGQRVRDEGLLYKLIPETHHSQADWPPHLVPAIWVRVDDPGEEWPEWRQPTGAHDAYEKGAKVSYDGHLWISDVDANVWVPGVYGWSLAD